MMKGRVKDMERMKEGCVEWMGGWVFNGRENRRAKTDGNEKEGGREKWYETSPRLKREKKRNGAEEGRMWGVEWHMDERKRKLESKERVKQQAGWKEV